MTRLSVSKKVTSDFTETNENIHISCFISYIACTYNEAAGVELLMLKKDLI